MANKLDKDYKDLLQYILDNGITKEDRTGTGTISIFDYSMKINMSEGFPLLTSKKMFTKGVIVELLWFLKGDTNIKYLVDNGCNIWNGDAYKNYKSFSDDNDLTIIGFVDRIKNDSLFSKKWGDLGPVYGKQWIKWTSTLFDENGVPYISEINQIENLINDLKNNPDSRRLMVTAWNPGSLESSVLPPCHYGFQCYTYEMDLNERLEEWCKSINKDISYSNKLEHKQLDTLKFPRRKISLKWTQRSCDSGLGIPFNIASYGFLLHMLAQQTNMIPNELIFTGGDVHIYKNHIEGVKTQLKQEIYKLPKLNLNKAEDVFSYSLEDFNIEGYESSPKVNYPLSN